MIDRIVHSRSTDMKLTEGLIGVFPSVLFISFNDVIYDLNCLAYRRIQSCSKLLKRHKHLKIKQIYEVSHLC